MQLLGHGFYWQDWSVGWAFKTLSRTIRGEDVTNFAGMVGMTEELFTSDWYLEEHTSFKGRLVPGALVMAMAEGLVIPATIGRTGLAFLGCQVNVTGPTYAGDTIHVEGVVTEIKQASKGNRALVRTENKVVTQNGDVVMTYDPLRMMKGDPKFD